MNKFYNFTAEKKTKNEGGLYSGKTITPAKVAEAGVDVGANAAKGGGHVFWSGGGNPAVEAAAREFATKNGMTTLEMTRAGQNMMKLTEGLSWDKAGPMWKRLSSQFAKGANG